MNHRLLEKPRELVKPIRCPCESPIQVPEKRSTFRPQHNEAPSYIAMRVSNEDRSPLGIHG
jgi:hypothetical protein